MNTNTITTLSSVEEYANNLRRRIKLLEGRLKTLPDGRLAFSKKNNCLQYYYRKPGSNKTIYLSKKRDADISALANKYYISKTLPKLKENLHAAEKFIALHSGLEESDLFDRLPKELQLRNSNLFVSKDKYIEDWLSRPYKRNPYKQENIIHETIRGEKVRSKSEVIIVNSAHGHRLPYLVEFPLSLGPHRFIYPDFTILHPKTLETIYWEHFGMMDLAEYANDAIQRIQLLDSIGIKLGKNLICTFESLNFPLSSALVESYIQQFFFT